MTVCHKLRVTLTPEPTENSVAGFGHITICEKILTRLLGPRRRDTILVPRESVDEVTITESAATPDDDPMALADAVGVTQSGGDAA